MITGMNLRKYSTHIGAKCQRAFDKQFHHRIKVAMAIAIHGCWNENLKKGLMITTTFAIVIVCAIII